MRAGCHSTGALAGGPCPAAGGSLHGSDAEQRMHGAQAGELLGLLCPSRDHGFLNDACGWWQWLVVAFWRLCVC